MFRLSSDGILKIKSVYAWISGINWRERFSLDRYYQTVYSTVNLPNKKWVKIWVMELAMQLAESILSL